MNRIKNTMRLGLFLLMAVGPVGCGGGGGDTGGGSGSNPTPPVIHDAVVFLSPQTKTVAVGATVTQTIDVAALKNAYYAAFDVTYDPQVLEHVGQLPGDFLNGTGDNVSQSQFHVALVDDAVPGRLKVGVTRLGTKAGVFGEGTLAVLTFEAVGPGTTHVAFDLPKGIQTFDDTEVLVTKWKSATVTVQ